jgi:hypothetical protein
MKRARRLEGGIDRMDKLNELHRRLRANLAGQRRRLAHQLAYRAAMNGRAAMGR